jgi:hypothetical protein
MDYRDHKPSRNVRLFELLASGVGLRQCARMIKLSRRCTELKFRKLGRHLRQLNRNLRGPLPEGCVLQFDELETYEECRNARPLSVPTLIERESRFIIWSESAPIRPRGRMSTKRRRSIARSERRHGPRTDGSRRSSRLTLMRGARLTRGLRQVALETDEKSSYRSLAKQVFGEGMQHSQTNSGLARMTWNPLFPINHSEAMVRDLTGRLRRESWLASKKRRFLDLQLQIYAAYRNYVRLRFNRDAKEDVSPAQLLGFVPRRLRMEELLGWRQDWRARSPSLLARSTAA